MCVRGASGVHVLGNRVSSGTPGLLQREQLAGSLCRKALNSSRFWYGAQMHRLPLRLTRGRSHRRPDFSRLRVFGWRDRNSQEDRTVIRDKNKNKKGPPLPYCRRRRHAPSLSSELCSTYQSHPPVMNLDLKRKKTIRNDDNKNNNKKNDFQCYRT